MPLLVVTISCGNMCFCHKEVAVLVSVVSHQDDGGLGDHGHSIAEFLIQGAATWLRICYIAAKQRATRSAVGVIELAEDRVGEAWLSVSFLARAIPHLWDIGTQA